MALTKRSYRVVHPPTGVAITVVVTDEHLTKDPWAIKRRAFFAMGIRVHDYGAAGFEQLEVSEVKT